MSFPAAAIAGWSGLDSGTRVGALSVRLMDRGYHLPAARKVDSVGVVRKHYRAALVPVLWVFSKAGSAPEAHLAWRNDMSAGSNRNQNGHSADLPEWADCDLFCIHDYAGACASACGWRGRASEVRHDPKEGTPLCPRCGFATLLRIPSAHPGKPGA